MIEIVQAEVYAPIHVRPATGARNLSIVANNTLDGDRSETSLGEIGPNETGPDEDWDVKNAEALAQPAEPDEDDIEEEEASLEATNANTDVVEGTSEPKDADASTAV